MWVIPVFASITCTVPVKQQIQIDSSDLKQKVVNTSSSVVAVLNTTSTECTLHRWPKFGDAHESSKK